MMFPTHYGLFDRRGMREIDGRIDSSHAVHKRDQPFQTPVADDDRIGLRRINLSAFIRHSGFVGLTSKTWV